MPAVPSTSSTSSMPFAASADRVALARTLAKKQDMVDTWSSNIAGSVQSYRSTGAPRVSKQVNSSPRLATAAPGTNQVNGQSKPSKVPYLLETTVKLQDLVAGAPGGRPPCVGDSQRQMGAVPCDGEYQTVPSYGSLSSYPSHRLFASSCSSAPALDVEGDSNIQCVNPTPRLNWCADAMRHHAAMSHHQKEFKSPVIFNDPSSPLARIKKTFPVASSIIMMDDPNTV
eukprot:5890890-Amphidinium_carterae.1